MLTGIAHGWCMHGWRDVQSCLGDVSMCGLNVILDALEVAIESALFVLLRNLVDAHAVVDTPDVGDQGGERWEDNEEEHHQNAIAEAG